MNEISQEALLHQIVQQQAIQIQQQGQQVDRLAERVNQQQATVDQQKEKARRLIEATQQDADQPRQNPPEGDSSQ